MSATSQPYGLRPINKIGGPVFAGSTRAIKIASAYGSNLYNGMGVNIHTDGTLIQSSCGSTPRVIGVFLGCQFTQTVSMKYFVSQQYWPASTVASDALGFVIDDPFAVFRIQADGTVAQASLGENVDVSAVTNKTGTDGSTVTGDSTMAANATTATTNTFAWRLVDFALNPGQGSAVGDTYTDLHVMWNFSIHAYFLALGF